MVSSSDWETLEAHFEALCDRPRDEQLEALEALDLPAELKTELASLLAFDHPTGGLDDLSRAVKDVSQGLNNEDLIGRTIGSYRLTRPLGAGGMGEVYLAERDDGRFEAKVAIKFVAASNLRAHALFERERQVLARLNHPGIARIIDAGEDERLGAYLVMEYVDGQAIDEAATADGPGPRQILRWIADAAEAVAFAHQNLVLHRDLKPAHLVIARDGTLKILDFGVAGLLDQRSSDGLSTAQGSFTPRYAAPEQILNQPATTRTDVYALGLILHERLAGGHGAFGDTAEAMSERKLADHRQPLPPVTGLARTQQRDLGAILHRCLAREPSGRYSGPADLSSDLQAVLNDAPARARRPGWVESGWRWARRHRIASGALALALCSIVLGTALVLRFATQAELDRQRAVAETNKARASTEFLADLFSGSTPGRSQGPETTARELLDRGRERMHEELADQPETRAYLEWVIARSFMFLGLYDEALALIETPAPSASLSLTDDRHLLKGRLLAFKGQFLDVLAHLETLELDRLDPLQRAQAELSRSTALVNLGDTAAAKQAADEVLRWAGQAEDGLKMRAAAQNMLAVIAYNDRDLDRARAGFEELLATRIRQYGESHAQTALVIHNLAGVSYALGDLSSALEQYERSAVLFEQHYGVQNRSFAMVQRALGMTLRKLGEAQQALERFDRTLDVIDAWSGSDNPLWREVLMQKVELLVLIDRETEARAALQAFGPMDPAHWEGRQSVACRWARLRAVLLLPEDTARWCDGLGAEPDHLRPGQDYLRALIARAARTPDFEAHRARAIESIDLISPPDPLLVAAIRRL